MDDEANDRNASSAGVASGSRIPESVLRWIIETDFDAMPCGICGSVGGSMNVDGRTGMSTCQSCCMAMLMGGMAMGPRMGSDLQRLYDAGWADNFNAQAKADWKRRNPHLAHLADERMRRFS